MNRCPLSYEPCEGVYSLKGLRSLSRNLSSLQLLPFTAAELRQEAGIRAEKMSIQGVQPKLSARLVTKQQGFVVVDNGGTFILKPQTADYPEVPENEDLSMHLAESVGIEVPLHGLVYGKDGALTYCVKRFDRHGRQGKYHVEDFSQLAGQTRDTKYRSSMEQVAQLIESHCTFPAVEKVKLFRLTIFSYLIGNEDMHLKNFSIITRDNVVRLSPAYDLINTTIILSRVKEELALALNGRKNNVRVSDFVDYFGGKRLQLPSRVINEILSGFIGVRYVWDDLIFRSFLSQPSQERYRQLVKERFAKMFPQVV